MAFSKEQRRKLVAAGFSRQAIYAWEQGISRPLYDTATRIRKVLKISHKRLSEILPPREGKAS